MITIRYVEANQSYLKPTLLVLGDDGSKAILNEVYLLDWLVRLFQNVAKRKVHWLKQRL